MRRRITAWWVVVAASAGIVLAATTPNVAAATAVRHRYVSGKLMPAGCDPSEELNLSLGVDGVRHWYYCFSDGHHLSSGNLIQCQITNCGHVYDNGMIVLRKPPKSPDGGGPSCQVIHQVWKECANGVDANGNPNPPVIVAVMGVGPDGYEPTAQFAPKYATPLEDFVSSVYNSMVKVWHDKVFRRCIAAFGGAAAGAVIVWYGPGSAKKLGFTMVATAAGTTSGCVTGALNYLFHD